MKKIINNILHRIKEDSLSRRKETAVRKAVYKELKSVKSALVIWSVCGDQADWLKKLADNFREVKFDKLCFMPAKEEFSAPADALVLRKEDLGFGGKISNEGLPAILAKPYDLLIDFSTEGNTILNYVALNSKAMCKVGMEHEGGEYDLIIQGVAKPLVFIDRLKEVLSEIKEY